MLPLHKLKRQAGLKEIFRIKLSSAEVGALYELFTNFSRVFTEFSRILKQRARNETRQQKSPQTPINTVFAGFSLWLLQLDCDSLRSLAPFGSPSQPSQCSASWSLSVEPGLVQSNPHPYILKKKKTTQVIFFPLAPPTGLEPVTP